MADVLVIDDDSAVLSLTSTALESQGHIALAAASGEEGLRIATRERIDAAYVDLRLPGMDGVTTGRHLRRLKPEVVLIAITGYPRYPGGVVDAIRAGFDDYFQKPLVLGRLIERMDQLLAEKVGTGRPSIEVPEGSFSSFEGMIGDCRPMRAVFQQIDRLASANDPVLVQGETGTGKELAAKAIHARSPRRHGPYIPVNCSAIGPESLLVSELFGHERGAYTDATERTAGWFEAAHRGTLFLDEIGELSREGQAKLLRVLETGTFTRLGGRKPITTDARVIAATNVDLRTAVSSGTFRSDLYHRLSSFVLKLPPLRERGKDIRILIDSMVHDVCASNNRPVPMVSVEAHARLAAHSWPGNVRELRNIIRRLLVGIDQGDNRDRRSRT